MPTRRSVRLSFRVLSWAVGVGMLGMPAFALEGKSTPGEDLDSSAEVDRVMATVPFRDELPEVTQAMGEMGLFADFPTVYASTTMDPDSGVLTVSYNEKADAATVTAFLGRLEKVATNSELEIKSDGVGFASAERVEAARSIAQDSKSWASKLGLDDIVGTDVDPATGAVLVFTSEPVEQARVPSPAFVGSIPIAVQGSSGGVDLQDRVDDYAPWTGGARIRHDSVATAPAECTLGFTWRKNETGELMGSTAEHCYEETGWSFWYNWGTFAGNRYYYNSVRDTTLLRGSPVGSFSASVFVGAATTGVIRDVNSAQPSVVINGAVALSGGISGLTVGSNISAGFFDSYTGKGPMVRTTVSSCSAGDSGSPWLTTLSGSGDAVAHGQHVGRITVAGAYQCLYMPVSVIAPALTATIATR